MLEITQYQNQGLLWYGNRNDQLAGRLATGFDSLDKALSGGWPPQGVVDIKTPMGIGEIRLMLPYLQNKQAQGLLVLIAPPTLISAEFLLANGIDLSRVLLLNLYQEEEALWAAEQCLKSGCCALVLLWQKALSVKQARRLLLSTEQGKSSLLLYRLAQKAMSFSIPSHLSMSLQPHELGIQVRIDKQRGGQPSAEMTLDMQSRWPDLTLPSVTKGSNVLPFSRAVSH